MSYRRRGDGVKCEISVPFKLVRDVLPLNCLINCEQQVEREGGRLVVGWRITETPYYSEHSHHAVWEDESGQVWEITPNLVGMEGDGLVCVGGPPTRFVPDPTAKFVGEKPNRQSLPTRFVPKHDNPALHRALDYLDRSNQALYEPNIDKAHYWQDRAEAAINQFATRTRRPKIRLEMPPVPPGYRLGCEGALAV